MNFAKPRLLLYQTDLSRNFTQFSVMVSHLAPNPFHVAPFLPQKLAMF